MESNDAKKKKFDWKCVAIGAISFMLGVVAGYFIHSWIDSQIIYESEIQGIGCGDYEDGEYFDSQIEFKKPVIYLYPEEETEVNVSLNLNDDSKFTCIYPSFNFDNVWSVVARPNGDIQLGDKVYNYLYWEADMKGLDFNPQYCVRGTDTAEFLEVKLAELGLNDRESNEFITYWLPQMQSNSYNLISFDTEEYCDLAKLDIEPHADTIIRVFMSWKASDDFVELEAPEIVTPVRNGFTVVEWGGTEVED